MRPIIFRSMFMFSLLLILVGMMAACSPSATPEPQLTGKQVLDKMVEAIKATNSTSFTAQFQVATAEGATKGTVKVSAERPDKFRAEVTSEDPALNGLLAVSNAEKGWAYSPADKLVLAANKSDYKTQLNEQPELRELLHSSETVVDQGFDDKTKAEIVGSEAVDGHQTYKVQVTYDKAGNPKLGDVTTVYFIDKESFLPRRVEMTAAGENASASGFVTLTDLKTGESIEAKTFTFEPPADAVIMNLNEMKPPKFEMPPAQ